MRNRLAGSVRSSGTGLCGSDVLSLSSQLVRFAAICGHWRICVVGGSGVRKGEEYLYRSLDSRWLLGEILLLSFTSYS